MSATIDIDKMAGQEFLKQASKALEDYCDALQSLHKTPNHKRPINKAIQKMQIIKGAASFSALHSIEVLAQSSIITATAIREKNLTYNDNVFKALVSLVKSLREQFAAIKKSGRERSKDYDSLLDKLHQLKEGKTKVSFRLSAKQINQALDIQEEVVNKVEEQTTITEKTAEDENAETQTKAEQTDTEASSSIVEEKTEIKEEEKNTINTVEPPKENEDTENFQFLSYKDDKATINLGNKISLDNIKLLHEEIINATEKAESIQVNMEDIQKLNTPLVQLLQSLRQYKKVKELSFVGLSKNAQTESEILGISL